MSLTPGTRIGPYEVIAPLGAGGMGEVYRARDAKLQRDVAIKVLPDLFAQDAERLARFEREARTLAALNHPNIAAIYGIEESGAGRALVMELVDGEDLSVHIARGPIPLAEALPIAKQIADALEAAHEAGIIHRDLKPANIKVRENGAVKVLDFGLAKAVQGDGSRSGDWHQGDGPGLRHQGPSPSESPTLTARATQMGMIIGTAAYMAPEQAKGRSVDRRADIWAFGVVLFEMLTGRRAFAGDDISDVLASVLKTDPDWTALPADLPPSIRRLLRRCLEKDPRMRLGAISDARLELEEREAPPAATQAVGPSVLPSKPSLVSRLWPALAGVVVTAVIAALLWPKAAGSDRELMRLSILAPPGATVYPDSSGVSISPDGTMVAFLLGSVVRSETELWVRSLDTMESKHIEGADGALLPFWSPDSRRIGFFTVSGKLSVIAVSGGRAEALCDAPSGRGAVWTSSNVIIFAPDAGGPLLKVSASGGTPTPITKLDSGKKEYGHRFPTMLPDGVHFLYVSLPGRNGQFNVYAGSLNDDSRVLVGAMEAAPVYADPGYLLISRQGVLDALPFDAKTLKITGDPIALGDEPSVILDPATSWTAARSTSISNTGALAYFSSPSVNTTAEWYDLLGRKTGTLHLPPGHYESASVSPDGMHAVFVRSTSPSESALWLVDLVRGSASLLSSGHGRNDAPVWSPDGTRVVFASDRDGPENVYVKSIGDAAPEQLLFQSDVPFKNIAAWSPDGKWLVVTQLDAETQQNIYLLPATGAKALTPFFAGPKRDSGGPVSPDGRWMLHSSDDTGHFEIYAQSFPTPGHKTQLSQAGAVWAWWGRDGRQVFFIGADLRALWRVDVTTGATFSAGTPTQIATFPPDIISFDAMPDRQKFLAIAPERVGAGSVTVVHNWRAVLGVRK